MFLLTRSEGLKKSMVSIWKLEEGECYLHKFDRTRKDMWMTSIKEYREQSISLDLKAGRYMIVPR